MSTDSSNDKSQTVNLASFRVAGYTPGAGIVRRVLWYAINTLVFSGAWFPLYAPKRLLLRLFGAQIGTGVVIKPRVNIKHPWRLTVGNHSWVGEDAWIDNQTWVRIGSNVCISQGAYLLTGNHDYKDPAFCLIVKEIHIEDGAWVGARAVVCPGTRLERNAVLTVGSVLTKDGLANGIYQGNPAVRIRERTISKSTHGARCAS